MERRGAVLAGAARVAAGAPLRGGWGADGAPLVRRCVALVVVRLRGQGRRWGVAGAPLGAPSGPLGALRRCWGAAVRPCGAAGSLARLCSAAGLPLGRCWAASGARWGALGRALLRAAGAAGPPRRLWGAAGQPLARCWSRWVAAGAPHRWPASGSPLALLYGAAGRVWAAAGPPLGRRWGATESSLDRDWGAAEPPLGRRWARRWGATGSRLARLRAAAGPPLGRDWVAAGPPLRRGGLLGAEVLLGRRRAAPPGQRSTRTRARARLRAASLATRALGSAFCSNEVLTRLKLPSARARSNASARLLCGGSACMRRHRK